MKTSLLLKNCKLYTSLEDNNSLLNILIENKKILKISKNISAPAQNYINAAGRIITPGLIDVHIQGAGGADILDSTEDALKKIASTCARFGTTSFLATTIYRTNGHNPHLATAVNCVGKDLGGANLLGLHLEGPFISMQRKGMIKSDCICSPSPSVLENILQITGTSLKMMTIAPELPGNLSLIREITSSGIIASFGHSNATYNETKSGIQAGITHVTHLFNTMKSVHHRQPGPILAIFEANNVSTQLISDGVHLHPHIVRFAYQNIGEKRCVLITDGMQALGLADGKYYYNGIEYESKNGTARYCDGTLIGTASPLSSLILKFKDFTSCSFVTAIKAASENPARVLGIEKHRGFIKEGRNADIVLWDFDYSVWATIVNGKVVYKKD